MKTVNFIKQSVAAIIFAAISFTGCGGGDKNSATMSMTTAIEGKVGVYLAGTGTAVINWGDGGIPETVTLSAANEKGRLTHSHLYSHTFSVATNRIIAIEGQNITHLVCDHTELTALDVSKNTALTYLDCWDNRLASLDVSKNTALTYLGCVDNQLTSLDVSKNTALTELYCEGNQLTAERLNAIFGMLHSNAGNKIIHIHNPGARDCDQSIAISKGWTVDIRRFNFH